MLHRSLFLGAAFAVGCLLGGGVLSAAQKPKPAAKRPKPPKLDLLGEVLPRPNEPARAAPVAPAPPLVRKPPQTEDEKRIAALIEQLVSPNVEPKKQHDDHVDIPETYDRKAQVRVARAWDQLMGFEEKAFPQLLESAGDDRYCCTISSPSGNFNQSVGYVCCTIIQMQVEAYEDLIGWYGVWRPDVMPDGAAKWLAGRERRTLRELQIEAVDEAARQLTAMTAEKADDYSFATPKNFPTYQERGLAALQKFKAGLERSPRAAGVTRSARFHICGLPANEAQRPNWNSK